MAHFSDFSSVNSSRPFTGSVSHSHLNDRSAIDPVPAYYFNHFQPPAAHLSLHPPFTYSPLPMDIHLTHSSHPSATNTSGESPSSNTSNLSSTVVSTAGPVRKKPGRGPGKKDAKDRPAVSVRWDDGDLTDRLISAVENNERWLGVFAQVSNEPGQLRSSAPVAKRDLQREIARYLFQDDNRYDLNDRKVLESLAVSVKNKLFKLTTLFAECKQDLGDFAIFSNEREIPAGSELASLWNRIKEKFPQYLRIQELMRRAATSPRTSVDPLSPALETSHSHHGHPAMSPTTRARPGSTSTSHPLMPGQFNGVLTGTSSLKGAVDLPRESSAYVDSTYINNAAIVSPTYVTQSPRVHSSSGYPSQGGPQRRATGSFSAPNPGLTSRHQSGGMGAPSTTGAQHHPTSIVTNFASPASTQTVRAAPYHHRASISTVAEVQATLEESPVGGDNAPSPPLTAAIQSIVSTLTERKDRERSRAHELEILRSKREEAERIRWHQREMLRLKIQLIRAERTSAVMASAIPGAGPPHGGLGMPDGIGAVEDDLAMAAGLGDDGASMEGDGEGELEEEMFDPAPPGIHPHAPSSAITHEHLRAHHQGHSA